MSRQERPRVPDSLRPALEYFRDLGFRDLFIEPRAALPAQQAPVPQVPHAAVPVQATPQTATPTEVQIQRPQSMPPSLSPSSASYSCLDDVRAAVAACQKCPLAKTRKQTVFSDGSATARIMFVGEAPGADEDAQGLPFVGRAGQLLTRMIEAGMGLSRQDVYIANVLKCRPPENRNPKPDEIAECRGYLEAQLALVKPEVLVALGNFAAQFLLETEEGIMRLRGKWGSYRGIPVMPTFHPSFLLRQPDRKRDAWQDLILVLKKLGLPVPAAGK